MPITRDRVWNSSVAHSLAEFLEAYSDYITIEDMTICKLTALTVEQAFLAKKVAVNQARIAEIEEYLDKQANEDQIQE